MNCLKSKKGFTLIEVLVVVAVMGFLLLVAIPSFLSWRPNLNFRQATNDLFSDLQMAKMEAIKRNRNVAVTLDLDGVNCPLILGDPVPSPGGSYTIFYDDGAGVNAGNGTQEAGEDTIKIVAMPKYVALCDNKPAAPLIPLENTSFAPSGFATLTPANPDGVTVQNDKGRSATITLSISGNIELN